jgi:hypothetical protein
MIVLTATPLSLRRERALIYIEPLAHKLVLSRNCVVNQAVRTYEQCVWRSEQLQQSAICDVLSDRDFAKGNGEERSGFGKWRYYALWS